MIPDTIARDHGTVRERLTMLAMVRHHRETLKLSLSLTFVWLGDVLW